MQKSLRLNNQIRIPEVQVIDEKGNQLGVMPTFQALKRAQEANLDLVEVGPQMQPPIAKIMDYGKYMYRKERQEKGQTKQKDQEMKTVRVGFKTGPHDLKFKSEQIDEFLKESHPVKIELTLRGREKALAYMGREKLENFLKLISEPHVVQGPPSRSPYGWVTVIRKDKKK
ncbi:MAG: translation initiation factor IF-3 [Candidatus Taylorbacteria bacterium]|nr:translation initiation factor IF-3 [Candidatus Taylorbacteria bacterium]